MLENFTGLFLSFFETVFINVFNLSISASWIILAVILVRFLFRKSPRWVNCLLWSVVGLRLLLPFSFESVFSLIPSAQTISPEVIESNRFTVSSGVDFVDRSINDYFSTYYEGVTVPTGTKAYITAVLSVIWLAGIIALLVFSLVSYVRLYRTVRTATPLYDNIRQCETVKSPFILGFLKPKIYLPYSIDVSSIESIVAHERAHIKRKDHLTKTLAFLILSVYWFNPFMWLAYFLFSRDTELACDEKVIANMKKEDRQFYSVVLIKSSVNSSGFMACPLAFAEVGIKERVKNIMKYKKPALWLSLVAVILCIAFAVVFLTNPITPSADGTLVEREIKVVETYFKTTTGTESYSSHIDYIPIEDNAVYYSHYSDGLTSFSLYDVDVNNMTVGIAGNIAPGDEGRLYLQVIDNEVGDFIDLQDKRKTILTNGETEHYRYKAKDGAEVSFAFKIVSSRGVDWKYAPYLSATFYTEFPFEFDMLYDYVKIKCKNGTLVCVDDKYKRNYVGKEMTYEPYQHICWAPHPKTGDGFGNEVEWDELEFEVVIGDKVIYKGTIEITRRTSENELAVYVYHADFKKDVDNLMIKEGSVGALIREIDATNSLKEFNTYLYNE